MTDTATGHKERGLAIEIVEKGQLKDRILIDDDEVAPLLKGIDYLSKMDSSVTPLNSFDAAFTTRGGLRLAAQGTRQEGPIQTRRDPAARQAHKDVGV